MKGELKNYSILETSQAFDLAIDGFADLIKMLVKLLEKEKRLKVLGEEIIKTKRRVNALENITIPQIESDIRYIRQKLQEVAIAESSIQIIMKKMINQG